MSDEKKGVLLTDSAASPDDQRRLLKLLEISTQMQQEPGSSSITVIQVFIGFTSGLAAQYKVNRETFLRECGRCYDFQAARLS